VTVDSVQTLRNRTQSRSTHSIVAG